MMGFGLLLILVVIGLVVFVGGGGDTIRRWFNENTDGLPSGHRNAKEILDARLAQGEITPEEYREARDLINRG